MVLGEREDRQGSIPHTYSHPLFADKTLTVSLPLPPPLPQSHQWLRRQCCCGESVLFPLRPHLFFLLEKYYTTRALPQKENWVARRQFPLHGALLSCWLVGEKIRFLFGSFFTLTHVLRPRMQPTNVVELYSKRGEEVWWWCVC